VSHQLSQDVLNAGLDDWVPLAAIGTFARRLGATSDVEASDMGVAAVRELAEKGLVSIGEVSNEGFTEWQAPLEDSLIKIEKAWRSLHQDQWGFMCWLSNTPTGDELARLSKSEAT